ncbi:putative RNA-directed DNA polymerase from transposon X-element [Trichonephila clavata]|uniref:Putative RNA-directed DNA polymerase from transposon X-element n=1 Tax=Trichonephila clavata TaxID=2740835 RepID=A0A8X6LF22_TRICU|nr:putative RNA-directed DNA polymerase from transposon X-element [Trichonephila clavata]
MELPISRTPQKARKDDNTPCTHNNKFQTLFFDDPPAAMDVVDPPINNYGSSRNENKSKGYTPPITIDNVKNQAALLKHLQEMTKLKLQAQLIGTRMKIFPQTPYAYYLIRKYIKENNLEGHTFSLPEDKKLRAIIRGLPTDTEPNKIILELKDLNILVEECHNMLNRKTGAPMPLFIIICTKSENNRHLYEIKELNNMKIKVEVLREKYGAPQWYRCQGFFHSSIYCTRAPSCVKCAGDHITKESPPAVNFWDERANAQNNKNNQRPPFVPRQVSLAQVKAAIPTVQPQPIPSTSQTTQNPSSPIQDIPDLFSQLRDPEVVDLFNSLPDIVKIAKEHKLAYLPSSIIFTTIAFNRVRQNHTSLLITSWNAQALRSLAHELEEFINDWNPDVILVQETQLRPCDEVAIPNFNFYRADRPTYREGGTEIFIKKVFRTVKFSSQVNLLKIRQSSLTEATQSLSQ